MNTIETIMKRRSIRKFTDTPISNDDIRTILAAGNAGPSCKNLKDWHFIVVRNKELLEKMADANGEYAWPLKGADMGILVCGDQRRAFKPAPDYWVVDGSIACQNMILAARELGIGTVWLGTWPQAPRIENQRKLFDLPDYLIPHSVIAFGYTEKEMDKAIPDVLDEAQVTYYL